jgi:hypothetical protein
MAEHWTFRGCPPGEPIAGQTYRADGWAYVDPPGKMTPDLWQEFVDLFGEDHCVMLVVSEGVSGGEPFKRGQFLTSPTGWAKAEAAVAKAKRGHADA